MFVVREFIQPCGESAKTIVCENVFVARDDANLFLKRKYQELLTGQENWPGVWSMSLGENRYTIDNNDGDFLEGEICEKFEPKR